MNDVVRRADLGDLGQLFEFTVSEAREAEGINNTIKVIKRRA